MKGSETAIKFSFHSIFTLKLQEPLKKRQKNIGVPLKFTAMYCSQVSPDCLKIGLKLKLLSEFEREQRKTLTTLWLMYLLSSKVYLKYLKFELKTPDKSEGL